MASVKVLFILFDGAEWDVINPLLRRRKLPNLAKFMREGTHGRLRSLEGTALASPILWTSMASGKLPYKHGIKDFYDTANAVRCVRLWEIFANTQELMSRAEAITPRCLTAAQRNLFGLPPEPLPWCIELEKWPYHTNAWKQWLSDTRAGKITPLPTTP